MNEVDARMRAVDERLPQRFAASTYRPDAWTIRLIGGGGMTRHAPSVGSRGGICRMSVRGMGIVGGFKPRRPHSTMRSSGSTQWVRSVSDGLPSDMTGVITTLSGG